MEYKDYYQLMGIARDAKQDDIKRAYRKLARKYHPDVSKEEDAESKFKELTEAYEVLKDPEKRAAYDKLGNDWQAGQDFQPPPNWDANFEFSGSGFTGNDAANFSEFFEGLFGHQQSSSGFGRGRHGSQPVSQDHHAKILIDLEDSFSGATRALTLQSPTLTAEGDVDMQPRTLNVVIPKGIRSGQHIRLRGQGATSANGHRGDLYLEVAFRPHAIFRAFTADLELDLPITPWEAALGAKVSVPTPAGAVALRIPANTKTDQKFRLKGRGFPGKTAADEGDLYAVVKIALPPADSERAKQLYQQMQRDMTFNPREKLGV